MTPMEQAQARAMAQKKAQDQTKVQMFLDWIRNKMGYQPQPTDQAQTSPAGGYLTNKQYRTNQFDEVFR